MLPISPSSTFSPVCAPFSLPFVSRVLTSQTVWVLYLVRRELNQFIQDRHDFLTSKEHASLAQSRTVLLTGIPEDYLTVDTLKKFTSYLPGGAKNVWIARFVSNFLVHYTCHAYTASTRDLKELPDLFETNQKLVVQLEGAVTSLEKTANKLRLKSEKKKAKGKSEETALSTSDQVEKNNFSLAEQLVPRKERPTHRLSKIPLPLPCIGRKVDTIDWCRDEIAKNNKEIEEKRANIEAFKARGAAFIEFHTQIAAHMFAQ
jgi:hypothetical protein